MDRITNESNLWLNAIQMEDEGDYLKAFIFYLKDSAQFAKQNSLLRAALSCACAADCLVREGNLAGARQLYLQTAKLYEKNANLVIGHSVREALWSYQEAYEYYSLACENNKASQIFERHISLSRKINPFFGEKEAMDALRDRKMDQEHDFNTHSANMQVSADVHIAIANFLNEIGSAYDKPSQDNFQHIFNKIAKEKNSSEESITN
jgi:tetratricopeptide (TPR) repeat protein